MRDSSGWFILVALASWVCVLPASFRSSWRFISRISFGTYLSASASSSAVKYFFEPARRARGLRRRVDGQVHGGRNRRGIGGGMVGFAAHPRPALLSGRERSRIREEGGALRDRLAERSVGVARERPSPERAPALGVDRGEHHLGAVSVRPPHPPRDDGHVERRLERRDARAAVDRVHVDEPLVARAAE